MIFIINNNEFYQLVVAALLQRTIIKVDNHRDMSESMCVEHILNNDWLMTTILCYNFENVN